MCQAVKLRELERISDKDVALSKVAYVRMRMQKKNPPLKPT